MPVDNFERSYPQITERGWRHVGAIGLHGAMTETTEALRTAATASMQARNDPATTPAANKAHYIKAENYRSLADKIEVEDRS